MNIQNKQQVVAIQGAHLVENTTTDIVSYNAGKYPQYNSASYNAETLDLGDYIKTLFSHKLLIASTILLTTLLALLYTHSVTPTYKASTTLQIDQTTNKVVSYNVLEGQSGHQLDKNFYQTQYDILQSRKLAARVIEHLNLNEYNKSNEIKKPIVVQFIHDVKAHLKSLVSPESETLQASTPSPDLVTRPIELEFLSKLSIISSKKSNIVEVSYTHPEPTMAAKIANSIAENYIGMNLEVKGNSSIYAKKFISEQLTIAKSNLEKSEQELVDYAKENQIINTDDDQSIISSELQTLSTAYIEAKKELIFAESAYRKKHKISGTIRLMDNGVIQSLKQRIGSLEAKYAELKEVYKPNYPEMLQLNKEINSLRQQINKETTLIKQASSTNLKANYLAARQNTSALRGHLNSKKKEILLLRDKSIGYKVLERETSTNREIYNGLLQRMREIDVASGAVDNNIYILDAAFVPYKKHKPNTAKNLLAGGILGLFLGIALAFFRENNNDVVKTMEEIVELTNLPIIGRFPLIKSKKKQLLLHKKHDVAIEESFRSIAVDLGFSTEEGIPKILHITSAEPGEGKSSTAINIATIMAKEGSKVILVDADMRRSTLHKYLGIPNKSGLANLLSNTAELSECLQNAEGIPNLSILTAGVSDTNPAKLLASNNLLKLIIDLTKHYDHIVIDSPPVLGMADALILANRSHGTLFLTSNNTSKKTSITDALRRLSRSYTNVIGLILTKDSIKQDNYFNYKV